MKILVITAFILLMGCSQKPVEEIPLYGQAKVDELCLAYRSVLVMAADDAQRLTPGISDSEFDAKYAMNRKQAENYFAFMKMLNCRNFKPS